jgi:phosphoadenosine phosphosulfate reductase
MTMGLFETTEEELYQMAINRPLAEKIEKSLALIREYEPMALELSDDGYYVAFSGGKDSIVMERLFKMAGVKYQSWYNNVTIDPPELVQFIKRQYPGVKWNNPEKNLIAMIKEKAVGPPTRRMRWCCELYKERGGNGTFKAVGVRTEESARRKGLWTSIRVDSRTRLPVICPVLYWTDDDIWQFIRSEDMPYCSLYDEGFKRLGCVGCPLNAKSRIKEFQRWPKYEEMWKRGALAWWEKYRVMTKADGSPYMAARFATFEDYWGWWMEEKNVNDTEIPDCQMWLW